MDKSFDDTIHVLYSPNTVYSDYHYPFKYRCVVHYCGGELQFVYPLKWVEQHKDEGRKEKVRIVPSSRGFKKKQVTTVLTDLLNSDFNNTIQNVQRRIADYRAIVDSENVSQEGLIKATEDLLTQFLIEIGGLNLFFNHSAPDLLRDELIVDFYNRYNKGIAETESNYVVTAEYLNDCVYGIMKFIDPLLTAIALQQNSGSDVQSGKDFLKDKLRRFLLTEFLSCRRVNEMLLASPLEVISDSLSFLAQSCEFLHECQSELSPFNSDEKLAICVRIFSANTLEKGYHSFWQKWHDICTFYDENIIFTFDYMYARMQSDGSVNFHNLLSNKDFSKSVSQNFIMDDFSSVVFLALLEMIRNGDASRDSNTIKKNTYIIRCRNCKRFFIPARSNMIYCNQKAPGYDKTCAEIGAKRKSKQGRTAATIEYERIKNRLRKRISVAEKVENDWRADKLRAKMSDWKKREQQYKDQLNGEIISEDEYIKLINDAEKDIFSTKQ